MTYIEKIFDSYDYLQLEFTVYWYKFWVNDCNKSWHKKHWPSDTSVTAHYAYWKICVCLIKVKSMR